jgi:NTE family protein
LRGDRLEAFYRGHLGDLTLAQLRTPTYAPVWNVEHNRLDFVGPRTHPALPVARAIRMAVSLPLFVQPVTHDGLSRGDGGIVDIFPVRPVLGIEPAVDTAVAVNGFYPHEFGGEDITGWDARPLSIVPAASQVRTCQQAQLAREHLARLRRQTQTLLVEPVPYHKVAGTGFYEQFLDTRQWPEFMRAGRTALLAAMRQHAPTRRPFSPPSAWPARWRSASPTAGLIRTTARPALRSGTPVISPMPWATRSAANAPPAAAGS